MKLYEMAKLIRCKNAGPFVLTIDIIFKDHDSYKKALESKVLSADLISKLYGVPRESIKYFTCEGALAVKMSFPRKVSSGDFEDDDVFGCQYHAPLVKLDIPCA
jgi:hypothetical protein